MNAEKLDDFLDRKLCDAFRPKREQWLVLPDLALQNADDSTQLRAFARRADAIRCAKALSNGNIDHRVIRLGEQILVVATMNSL